MINLPPQLKNQYEQLVATAQRMNSFRDQKDQLEFQKMQLENAISELESAKDKNPDVEVYKNSGAILIKVSDIDTFLNELKEKNELIDMRLKTVSKQIERISQQYKSMNEKLQQSMQRLNQSQDLQPM
ncbi:MAG: prefoldin subunit beta [Candidatus Helarchaeota archaeon]